MPEIIRIVKDLKVKTATKEELEKALKGKASALRNNGTHEGIVLNNGTDRDWVRSTEKGLLPYSKNNSSSLGSEEWPFASVYSDEVYAQEVMAEKIYATTIAGNLEGTANNATHAINADTLQGKSLEEIVEFVSASVLAALKEDV